MPARSQHFRRSHPGDGMLGGFNPRLLPNLALWVRGDMGITIGTGVSAWADQSGNGNHLTQATGAKQPLFVASAANGRPGVRFDTSGTQFLATGAITLNQPENVFAALKVITPGPAGGTRDIAWDGIAAGNMVLGSILAAATSISAGTSLACGGAIAAGAYDYIGALYSGVSSELRVHGAVVGAGAAGANNAGGFTLGALGGGTRGLNVEFAEVIIYGRALSTAEKVLVETYLKTRYAL